MSIINKLSLRWMSIILKKNQDVYSPPLKLTCQHRTELVEVVGNRTPHLLFLYFKFCLCFASGLWTPILHTVRLTSHVHARVTPQSRSHSRSFPISPLFGTASAHGLWQLICPLPFTLGLLPSTQKTRSPAVHSGRQWSSPLSGCCRGTLVLLANWSLCSPC